MPSSLNLLEKYLGRIFGLEDHLLQKSPTRNKEIRYYAIDITWL
ncbi:MAG TPA: hypothetical protein VJ772_08145 [Nitrososphaeraceae archaeon]|nr:hypothetical protein [Nitrososphaeraceae archaeon]